MMLTTRRSYLQTAVAAGGGLASAWIGGPHARAAAGDEPVDVCVYGGTASGVTAAVAAAREGVRVVVVEPSRWLGGMTGGGLSHIDWGRSESVGGMARQMLGGGRDDPAYRRDFAAVLEKHRISVLFEHRVSAVERASTTIQSITLDHAAPGHLGCPAETAASPAARRIAARVFIDCSYEGDLMARAGVTYAWGRESRDEYGESLAGSQPPLAVYDIDPYVVPGDAGSGLLPLLQDVQIPAEGEADSLTMGYGFR